MFALFETEWSFLRQKRVNTYLLFKIGKANFKNAGMSFVANE